MIEPHNNNREYRTRGKFGGEDNAFKFVLVQFEIPIRYLGRDIAMQLDI